MKMIFEKLSWQDKKDIRRLSDTNIDHINSLYSPVESLLDSVIYSLKDLKKIAKANKKRSKKGGQPLKLVEDDGTDYNVDAHCLDIVKQVELLLEGKEDNTAANFRVFLDQYEMILFKYSVRKQGLEVMSLTDKNVLVKALAKGKKDISDSVKSLEGINGEPGLIETYADNFAKKYQERKEELRKELDSFKGHIGSDKKVYPSELKVEYLKKAIGLFKKYVPLGSKTIDLFKKYLGLGTKTVTLESKVEYLRKVVSRTKKQAIKEFEEVRGISTRAYPNIRKMIYESSQALEPKEKLKNK